MWSLGGHLGSAVSALVDGQLDPEAAERAWAHVLACSTCRGLVEREGWVKRRLTQIAGDATAPAHVLGSLYDLTPPPASSRPSRESLEAWAAVDDLARKGRPLRRAGLALVGAGSVSAAVFGMVTLGGPAMDIGGAPGSAPGGRPASSLTRTTLPTAPAEPVLAPTASVHLRTPGHPSTPRNGGMRDIAAFDND